MLDVEPGGLLQLNRGMDANRLNDLSTFISNAMLKSDKQIYGDEESFKIQCAWMEWASKIVECHWHIVAWEPQKCSTCRTDT